MDRSQNERGEEMVDGQIVKMGRDSISIQNWVKKGHREKLMVKSQWKRGKNCR